MLYVEFVGLHEMLGPNREVVESERRDREEERRAEGEVPSLFGARPNDGD